MANKSATSQMGSSSKTSPSTVCAIMVVALLLVVFNAVPHAQARSLVTPNSYSNEENGHVAVAHHQQQQQRKKSSEDLRRNLCSKVDEQIQELLMKYAEFSFKNCIHSSARASGSSADGGNANANRDELCRKAEQEVQEVVSQHVEFLQAYCSDVSTTLNSEAFLRR